MGVAIDTSEQKNFFLGYLTFEDGADKLTQNVGNILPFYAA